MFLYVEIEISFPIKFVLCTEIEIVLIQKKENMKKEQVNEFTFYFEIISKTNYDIIVMIKYIWKQHKF